MVDNVFMWEYMELLMIKRKIFSIFKNKFLIGTIAFSLVSTATLIPLSNNHNIQKKLDRSHQNDNFNEKK